VAFADGEVAE